MADLHILEDYYTRDGLRSYLRPGGPPVSHKTIAKYENEKSGLPFVVIAGAKLYPKEEVKAWLLRRLRRPNPSRQGS